MKRIIFILFFCVTIAMASPDAIAKGKKDPSTERTETKQEWNDSIEKRINHLSTTIENIDKTRLPNLETKIEGKQEKQSTWMVFIFWFSIILNISTLSLLIYLFIKQSEINKTQEYNLGKLKDKFNQEAVAHSRYTMDANNVLTLVQKEIVSIKQDIYNLNRNSKITSTNQSNNNGISFNQLPIDLTPKEETIYFGDVIGGNGQFYFNKSLSSRAGAIFRATKRGNEAEFEPLGLDVLVGNDNARNVIVFDGTTTQKAQKMQVTKKGTAVLKDGYWDVVRNAHVSLI